MKSDKEIMRNVDGIIRTYELETFETHYIFNEVERIQYAISILEEKAAQKQDEDEERALLGQAMISVQQWKEMKCPGLSNATSSRLGKKAKEICFQYGELPQKVDRLCMGTGKSKLIYPTTLYPEYTLDLAAEALRLPIKKRMAA